LTSRTGPCRSAAFIGISEKKGMKRFNLMNQICFERVMEHAIAGYTPNGPDGKPAAKPRAAAAADAKKGTQVLVFVHSRKRRRRRRACSRSAPRPRTGSSSWCRRSRARWCCAPRRPRCRTPTCASCCRTASRVHHAGLSQASTARSWRTLFADNHMRVLCSTATLAWGVNLPAHCVVIKGTQVYNPEKGAGSS
jgi:pre-mRNA-splicing helicase BRR2